MRKILIAFLIILCGQLKSQENVKHIVGIGANYFFEPNIAGNRGGINIVYAYTPNHFIIKLETGFAPLTNFGIAYKFYPSIGFTTKIKNPFSWHLGIGIGRMFCSKSYFEDGTEYKLVGYGPMCNSGFLFNFSKNNRLKVGIDGSVSMYNVTSNTGGPLGYHTLSGFLGSANVSFYYSIPNKKE